MDRALQKNKVFDLFLHNVRCSHNIDTIYPIKGPSNTILPLMHQESFDMVYVDGNHSYSSVKNDLINSSKLIKEGGILCGDDFNIPLKDIDRDFAEKNKETNIIIDPKTKQPYHPGVSLAVSEFFGMEISCYNGFWLMRKCKNHWEKILLNLNSLTQV